MSAGGWGGRRAQRLVALALTTYGTTCHLCGRPGADSADHLIPRSHGGPDDLTNLRPAHRSCNYSRGNQSLASWRRKHSTAPASDLSPRWQKPPAGA